MIKKTFIILFIVFLSTSCGKKGPPVYNEESKDLKIFSVRQIIS